MTRKTDTRLTFTVAVVTTVLFASQARAQEGPPAASGGDPAAPGSAAPGGGAPPATGAPGAQSHGGTINMTETSGTNVAKPKSPTVQSEKTVDAGDGSDAPVTDEDLVDNLLAARCHTALCFRNGAADKWLGIEPLVELPVGKAFSVSGGSLSDYVNNHDIRVDLAAGLRVWIFRDVVSLSVYLSKALTAAPVRIAGSSFSYPANDVRRPYPGLALGLLYDSLWVGLDRDELRNGDTGDATADNPAYPPNALVSSSWTVTIAVQPFTSFRTAIGLATGKKKESAR